MSEYVEGYEQDPTDSLLDEERHLERQYRRTRRRVLGATALTAVALAGLGGALYYNHVPNAQTNVTALTTESEASERVSELTSKFTGSPIRVSCDDELLQSTGGLSTTVNGVEYTTRGRVYPLPLGVLQVSVSITVVSEQVCADVLAPANYEPEIEASGAVKTKHFEGIKNLARAVATLLHEKEHTMQVLDEAQANCYAYQKLPGALIQLSIPADTSTMIADYITNEASEGVYPPHYYTSKCVEGGEYDLQLGGPYLQKISPQ